MLRRFVKAVGLNIGLGNLAFWYDSSDSSTITIEEGIVTQIENKGSISNTEMVLFSGSPQYILNAVNGLNVVRGNAVAGFTFSAVNSDKSTYRFMHTGNYSIYFVTKWNIDQEANLAASTIMTTKISSAAVGTFFMFDNRQTNASTTQALRFLTSNISASFTNYDNQENIHLSNMNIPVIDSQQASLFKNGDLIGNFNWKSDQNVDSLSVMTLGASFDTRFSFKGDLCEVKVYEGMHDEEERNFVSNSLMSKWGITT